MRGSVFAAIAAWALSGCASTISGAYEQARLEALADPGPVPESWTPDAIIDLSPLLVDKLVRRTLSGRDGLVKEFHLTGLSFATRVLVLGVQIDPSTTCATCLTVTADLGGLVSWNGFFSAGTADVIGKLVFDAEFYGEASGNDTLDLAMRVHKVHRSEFDIPGIKREVRLMAGGHIATWLSERLLPEIPPVRVMSLGTQHAPIRALRARPQDAGLRIEVLTSALDSSSVDLPKRPLNDGWRLLMGSDTLLSLARTAAFNASPNEQQVTVEPLALELEGNQFSLEMRIWRLKGRGWHRDYLVMGAIHLDEEGLHLVPEWVSQTDASAGAGFADPIALLGQGAILKAIEDALTTTVPTRHAIDVAPVRITTEPHSLRRIQETLEVTGDLRIRRLQKAL